MKKLHLIAAAAALLLSGGVFVKTNQQNKLLDANLEALTASEVIWWEAPGTGDGYYHPDTIIATYKDYSNPNHPKIIQTMITRTCEPSSYSHCDGQQYTKIITW